MVGVPPLAYASRPREHNLVYLLLAYLLVEYFASETQVN